MELLKNIIKKDDLCFDIGANNGDKTLLMINLGAKVVCVEPQSACIAKLRDRFGTNTNVLAVVDKALGPSEGSGVIKISKASTLSTMSEEFIEKTSRERFDGVVWDKTQAIEISTLDALIEKFGNPDYCKIDVEGFEVDVLLGLTCPIKCLSVEFIPELKENAFKCMEIVSALGNYVYNYSEGESGVFSFESWLTKEEMASFLVKNNDFKVSFGDLYMKLHE